MADADDAVVTPPKKAGFFYRPDVDYAALGCAENSTDAKCMKIRELTGGAKQYVTPWFAWSMLAATVVLGGVVILLLVRGGRKK